MEREKQQFLKVMSLLHWGITGLDVHLLWIWGNTQGKKKLSGAQMQRRLPSVCLFKETCIKGVKLVLLKKKNQNTC